MKTLRNWIIFVAALFSVAAEAASEKYECKFSNRLDESSYVWSDELEKDVSISVFEGVNDFVFDDYPWLLIESVTGGWKVSIGALSYGEDRFSADPSTITKSIVGDVALFSYNNPEGDSAWVIRFNPKTSKATLVATDDDGSLIETAEFVCE